MKSDALTAISFVSSRSLSRLSLSLPHQATVKASTAALAEFLQNTDIKLETVPFYDKRAESLNWRRYEIVPPGMPCPLSSPYLGTVLGLYSSPI